MPVKAVLKLLTKEIRVIIALLIFISAVWLFFEIADEVAEGTTQQFDEAVLMFLRNAEDYEEPRGPYWLKSTVRDLTSLGGGPVLILLIASVLGFLLLRKEYLIALLVLFATLGGTALGQLLKNIFGRERPTIVTHLMDVGQLSFPSGHSLMSAVVYLSLAALLSRIQKRRIIRIYIFSIALLLTFIVGLTRIYLGVHYPTDVIGGWSVGLAWATFCWFLAWFVQKKSGTGEIDVEEEEKNSG
jgi:undecaprenyl-diphosphatase